MKIYLVGYQPKFLRKKHTNFWPWNYLTQTFNEIGYEAYHCNPDKIDHSIPNIYICWNAPDTIELIEKYAIHKESVVIQKLTAFDTSPESVSWSANREDYESKLKEWTFPSYRKLEKLEEMGVKFFAFGARSAFQQFPEKKRIVEKYQDKIFWIPWGPMSVPYDQIISAKPIMSDFEYDIGFVGSKWGDMVRGNLYEWEHYLQAIIDNSSSSYIAGPGTKRGSVSVNDHLHALKKSRLCPIIHATGWKVEQGVMDRFWTVFSLGRFGVCDNVGIYEFFNEDEVVLAQSAEEYIDKSLYYMKNVDKQLPYIESAMKRIKAEYNQRVVWKNILDKVHKTI